MDERKKVIVAVITFFVLLAVVVLLYFFVFKEKPEQPVEPVQVEQETPVEEEPIREEPETPEPLDLDLEQSDDTVRELASELSSHAALSRWLKSDDIIINLVAAIDNIANGESPRSHIEFFKPTDNFDVVVNDGIVSIDPASYRRYNLVADVFSSLSSKATARLFLMLKPTLQEAYKELGYPNKDLQETLVQAISELLKVPVLDRNVEVVRDVVSYKFVDPRLESLNPAQKHLLRMGPENVEIIQAKLRELAKELGIPDSQIPQKF